MMMHKELYKKLKNIKIPQKKIIIVTIALLLFIGLWAINKKDNPKVINAAKQVNELAESIQTFYRNRPNAWGLNTETVIKEKISPLIMTQGGQALVNYLDKKTTVGSDKNGSMLMPGDRSFKITYWDLNKEECIKIASLPISEKMQLSLNGITISNENESIYGWGEKNSLPIEITTAKKACSGQNTIIWDILL